MFITVTVSSGEVDLVEPTVFTAFHVAAEPADALGASVAEALGEIAEPLDNDHVWVRADQVRTLAGAAADHEWEESFAAMLAYASSKGWCSGDGALVRAHIERTA